MAIGTVFIRKVEEEENETIATAANDAIQLNEIRKGLEYNQNIVLFPIAF